MHFHCGWCGFRGKLNCVDVVTHVMNLCTKWGYRTYEEFFRLKEDERDNLGRP